MKNYKVAVFVGSLRKGSYSKMLAAAFQSLAPKILSLQIIEIGDLPLFNQDYDEENKVPETYARFRKEVKQYDAFLFITPEYNRSTTAVLKNALDVGSRPYGANVWDGKPGAVVSLSIGAAGGFGANHHLRQSLVCLNVATMPNPEVYIGNVQTLFDDAGQVVTTKTKNYFYSILETFANWINQLDSSK